MVRIMQKKANIQDSDFNRPSNRSSGSKSSDRNKKKKVINCIGDEEDEGLNIEESVE